VSRYTFSLGLVTTTLPFAFPSVPMGISNKCSPFPAPVFAEGCCLEAISVAKLGGRVSS
jgi:hypothetical protein